MNQEQFKAALAEFTSKTATELDMADRLEDIGVDSIGVFEFTIKVEDEVGAPVEVDESLVSVQDLYEAVLDAAGQPA